MKNTIGIGLVVLAIFAPAACNWWVLSTEPLPTVLPEVGMSTDEVLHGIIGKGTSRELDHHWSIGEPDVLFYYPPPDRWGNRKVVPVRFSNGHVIQSSAVPLKERPFWMFWHHR